MDGPDEDAFRGGVREVAEDAEDVPGPFKDRHRCWTTRCSYARLTWSYVSDMVRCGRRKGTAVES